MKIRSIQISNILSFQEFADIDNSPHIKFDDGLNVIIGPNGAGKSNFLEVINRLFKNGLMRECIVNKQLLMDYRTAKQSDRLSNVLRFDQQRKYHLPKNKQGKTEKQMIKVTIGLNDNDKENLKFIATNAVKINDYLKRYSNFNGSFDENISLDRLLAIDEITFLFESDSFRHDTWKPNDLREPISHFIFMYFQWFNFIQNIILIVNEFNDESWPSLKNIFTIMSGYRNYGTIQSTIRINNNREEEENEIRNAIFNEGARIVSNNEPAIFRYVRHKIFNDYVDVEIKLSLGQINNEGKSTIDLLKSPILNNMNQFLEKFLRLNLKIVRKSQNEYEFNFEQTESREIINISELSSGEKEILNFVFNLFGYDLGSGVMIIDEPELHLHPQLQEKFLEIIRDAESKFDIQFLIATHSPIFVNETTVDGLIRFFKNSDGYTCTIKPELIPLDIRNKIRLLTFTSSSIIFFNNIVILTESFADKIFFKIFCQISSLFITLIQNMSSSYSLEATFCFTISKVFVYVLHSSSDQLHPRLCLETNTSRYSSS